MYPPPNHSAEVTLQRVGQEAILYDRQHGCAHVINDSAARIWELCDGHATIDEIVRAFAQAYNLPPSAVHDDVLSMITTFRTLGVLN